MNLYEISGYRPGAIGRITELHAIYYSKHWEFGLFFESKVATEMSEFLNRFDEARDGFWVVCIEDVIIGSVTIDGIKADKDGAHLRWFITDPAYHGRGIGNRLMVEAMAFCQRMSFNRVYLWTFEGLDPARHLYERHGFKLAKELKGNQWGKPVNEQMFELII